MKYAVNIRSNVKLYTASFITIGLAIQNLMGVGIHGHGSIEAGWAYFRFFRIRIVGRK
jgi:hypothetical protein